MVEPLVRAFVAAFTALEQVQRDPSALEMLDRVSEDVFSALSNLSPTDVSDLRSVLELLRSEAKAQYRVDAIDLILRNISGG